MSIKIDEFALQGFLAKLQEQNPSSHQDNTAVFEDYRFTQDTDNGVPSHSVRLTEDDLLLSQEIERLKESIKNSDANSKSLHLIFRKTKDKYLHACPKHK